MRGEAVGLSSQASFRRGLVSAEQASLAYWSPLRRENGKSANRDEFGNRLFLHPKLAYRDRSGATMRMGLLVTPQGQELLRARRRILPQLETALEHLHRPENYPGEIFSLPAIGKPTIPLNQRGDRTITYLTEGGQSIVYLLEAKGDKYVIELKNPRASRNGNYEDPTQPYVNEMLQVQSLQRDMGYVLSANGIETATYLFASPVVACQIYEEGRYPTDREHDLIIKNISDAVLRYVKKKRDAGKPLWENVIADMRLKNFLKKPDGTFVWFDCFSYVPPDEEPAPILKFVPKPREG